MIVKHLAVRGWFRQAIMGIIATRLRFQSPRGEGVVQTISRLTLSGGHPLEFQSPHGEGVVQTVHALKAISRGSRRFNHLAVRGWFRLDVSALVVPFRSFNHLAVRGWFRLQTHKPAWLCGKLGFEF